MFVNVFGGLALPACASIIQTRFRGEIGEVVLELSVLCSLVTTMTFTTAHLFVFERTRGVWTGCGFAVCGGFIVVGGVVVISTYIFTSSTRRESGGTDTTTPLLSDGAHAPFNFY